MCAGDCAEGQDADKSQHECLANLRGLSGSIILRARSRSLDLVAGSIWYKDLTNSDAMYFLSASVRCSGPNWTVSVSPYSRSFISTTLPLDLSTTIRSGRR